MAVILGRVPLGNKISVIYKAKYKYIIFNILEELKQLRYKEQEEDWRQQRSLKDPYLNKNLLTYISQNHNLGSSRDQEISDSLYNLYQVPLILKNPEKLFIKDIIKYTL